jgi:dihydrofolate reductase
MSAFIGRKTYETVLAFDAWPYGKKQVVVLSTRPSYPSGLVQSEYAIAV